jgi:hypothetical protein
MDSGGSVQTFSRNQHQYTKNPGIHQDTGIGTPSAAHPKPAIWFYKDKKRAGINQPFLLTNLHIMRQLVSVMVTLPHAFYIAR